MAGPEEVEPRHGSVEGYVGVVVFRAPAAVINAVRARHRFCERKACLHSTPDAR